MTSFETALLYHAHHTLHPDDLPFWLEIAGRQAGPILELGCGTGRVLLPLIAAGHTAWGLDYDAGMLRVMRREWVAGGAAPGGGPGGYRGSSDGNARGSASGSAQGSTPPGPPVFQADFTRFHLGVRLGLALLPCNTYSTLATGARRALLDCLAGHLSPGGLFVVSMPNAQVLSRLPPRGPAELEETFPHPLDGEPVQVSSAWRRTRRSFSLAWHYDHLLPDGAVQRTSVQVEHHLEPLDMLLEEMQAAGFALVEMYGDYDQSAVDIESPYWIMVLQKK